MPEQQVDLLDESLEGINQMKQDLDEVFESEKTRSYEWRLEQILGIQKLLTENREGLFKAAQTDINRTAGEMGLSFNLFQNEVKAHIKNLRSWMNKTKVSTPTWIQPASSYIIPEPLGCVLILGAWNVPFYVTLLPALQAIAAGNCVVMKFSEHSPAQSLLAAQLIPKYVDPICVKTYIGPASSAQYLMKQKWDLVFYTGGEKVGKIIAKTCAETLTPCVLELGGKCPCYVGAETNFDMTAKRILQGKFFNSGQLCISPDYVICSPETKPLLLEALKRNLLEFFGENPRESNCYGGKIINELHFDRLTNLLKQGTIVQGGESDRDGFYFAPTIMTDVPLDSELMTDEIFGPILVIHEIPTLKESIKFINARPKPLALYSYGSAEENEQLVQKTSAGSVGINDCLMQVMNSNLPFGGVGASGYGSYHEYEGFKTFSHMKPVLEKSTWVDAYIRYPPHVAEDWVQSVFSFLM